MSKNETACLRDCMHTNTCNIRFKVYVLLLRQKNIHRSTAFTKIYFNTRCGVKIKKTKWWENDVRKRRKDCLSMVVKQQVQEFFKLPEIIRQVPGQAEVVVIKDKSDKKTIMTKHQMTMTLHEASRCIKA